MSKPSLYDAESLQKRIDLQLKHALDFGETLPWQLPLDLTLPLVPLDEKALIFAGASAEQRLVISQMMGVLIAVCVYEMEDCLIRLREKSWDALRKKYPVSPEFRRMGDMFFEEEVKHSAAFRRFVEKFALDYQMDLSALQAAMPRVEGSYSEFLLATNVGMGGQSFWWIVAIVEQQFLALHQMILPHRRLVEPLYFEIHKRHFEEESRHAPFPYLLLELLAQRTGIRGRLHTRTDLATAQGLQAVWAVMSLKHLTKSVKRLKGSHPLFDVLNDSIPLLEKEPLHRILWKLLTETPYVSTLINPNSHQRIQRFADGLGAPTLPFPDIDPKKLVNY